MPKKVLVVGRNSNLANNFLKKVSKNTFLKIDSCNHNDIPTELQNYDVIINFSFNPILYTNQYKEEFDQDLKIARLIKGYKNIKLATISSRKVYGTFKELKVLQESDVGLGPNITTYGLNKVKCENNIKNCLDDDSRLLICRGSNIFGNKVGGRNFVNIALNSLLREGVIKLDVSQNVIRDFLPIDKHSQILESLIINDVAGTYNVGSGAKVSLGDLCNHFVKGFKIGTLEDTDLINDQFILDLTKLNKHVEINITSDEVLSYAYDIGKKMRDNQNAV